MLTVAIFYVNICVTFIIKTDMSFIPCQNKNKYLLKFGLCVIWLRKKEINTERKREKQKERQSVIKTENRKESQNGRSKER